MVMLSPFKLQETGTGAIGNVVDVSLKMKYRKKLVMRSPISSLCLGCISPLAQLESGSPKSNVGTRPVCACSDDVTCCCTARTLASASGACSTLLYGANCTEINGASNKDPKVLLMISEKAHSKYSVLPSAGTSFSP